MAVNQIGERVKWDKKSGGFVLGRRGSIFRLHAYVESTDKPLDDLRDTSNVNVILECNGLLLVLDLSSGMARSVKMPDDIVPDDAKLLYVKRKFDGSSVSISSMVAPHLWLRHCNSRLMFDERGVGVQFCQDASFILTPIISQDIVAHIRLPLTEDAIHSTNCDNKNVGSLEERLSNAMKKAKLSNELLSSRLNPTG